MNLDDAVNAAGSWSADAGHARLFQRFTDILLSARTLPAFCEELLEELADAAGASAGVLFMADAEETLIPFVDVGPIDVKQIESFLERGGAATVAVRSSNLVVAGGDECARLMPGQDGTCQDSPITGVCAAALGTEARLVGAVVMVTTMPAGFGLSARHAIETLDPIRLARAIEVVGATSRAIARRHEDDARANASRVLQSVADPHQRVGHLAEQMARVAGVSRCFIFEVVDGAQQLVGASGATRQQLEAARRGLEGPLGEIGPELQRIADGQRPGLVTQDDMPSQEAFGGECEMVSALVVPLSYGGRVTGLAYLDEPGRPSSFNENQLAALDALTDIAAVGAHSAQIQRRVAERVAMQRHQDRLSAMHHIINQVRIHLEETRLLGSLPRLISDGLGYDRVYIYLIQGDEFTFAGGYFRRHEKECERFEACARRHPPRMGEPSIEVEVYRHGIAQVVADPSADPRVIRQHQKLLRSPSAVFVPLWGTQSVLGVLFADYKYQEMAVSEEDTSLLSVLGTGIGTALENVRLYAEARSDRDKLSTLLANSDDAIIIVDRDRNIVAFNKASERLSGVTAADAVGSNCQEVWRCCDERGRVLGEQSCPVAARIAGLRRDQATYTEHTIRTNDGREVEVASTFAYVEGPDGTVEQGMEILRDLTEHKRWLRERHIADTLQKALLPVVAQADLGIDVGVHYESATIQAAVGGDFYDFIKLDDGRVGIAIGDVCGKGIDAAHHATMTKFTLRAYLLEGASPAALISRLNDAIAAQLHPGEFISMCFGLLDPVSGSFTYANAGHPRPLLRQEGKGWRSLDRSGIVLGAVPNQSYEEETVELGPEDTLLFYTDGLVETRRGPTCFGEERLMQFLSRCRVTGAQQFAERVHQRSAKFSGGHLLDDVAVVVVRL